MHTCSFRSIGENDLELYRQLCCTTFIQSHGHSASEHDVNIYLRYAYNSIKLRRDHINPYMYESLIILDELPIGFYRYTIDQTSKHLPDQKLIKLDRLYILDQYHDKGYGQQCLDHILAQLNRNDHSGIFLYVWIQNERAKKFYAKNGFQKVGEEDFRLSSTHSNPNDILYRAF